MMRLLALGILAFGICSHAASATPNSIPQRAGTQLDFTGGHRSFDWEFGTWKTHVRVLRNPLSGEPPEWTVYAGTSVIKPLMGGRANFVELSVKSDAGAIEGGALRLYNPKTGQWSLNYVSVTNGLLTAPVFGGFDKAGRGVFTGLDQVDGRTVLVRFVITRPSAREARFEQSYSADGGVTWETNWLAVDTRI